MPAAISVRRSADSTSETCRLAVETEILPEISELATEHLEWVETMETVAKEEKELVGTFIEVD